MSGSLMYAKQSTQDLEGLADILFQYTIPIGMA